MKISRRTALATATALAGLPLNTFPLPVIAEKWGKLGKAATFIVIGAGNRGSTYSKYAQIHPDEMVISGVAEPIEERRKTFSELYSIPKNQQFRSWEQVFDRPRFADAVIISTPDNLHFGPAMKAMEMGYHVLLEKPISPTEEECQQIAAKAKEKGVMVAVCHVLRYSPYFKALKKIMEAGTLGEIMNIDHFEPVGYWHIAHSFVRGNWRKTSELSFMLLAKSCHDMDIMRWLVNEPCQTVASFGSLQHFRPNKAPAGASDRCVTCKVEPDCPYSAMRLYLNMDKKGWPVSVISDNLSLEGRKKAITKGPYGRCVYHSDNDVVDHQVVIMQFAKGTSGSFTMLGFTPQQNMGMRQTRIMGSKGFLSGDMQQFTITSFLDNKQTTLNPGLEGGDAASGHGGGDMGLIRSFVNAVRNNDPSQITSTIDVSVESHIMAFKAEESRLKGTVVKV